MAAGATRQRLPCHVSPPRCTAPVLQGGLWPVACPRSPPALPALAQRRSGAGRWTRVRTRHRGAPSRRGPDPCDSLDAPAPAPATTVVTLASRVAGREGINAYSSRHLSVSAVPPLRRRPRVAASPGVATCTLRRATCKRSRALHAARRAKPLFIGVIAFTVVRL